MKSNGMSCWSLDYAEADALGIMGSEELDRLGIEQILVSPEMVLDRQWASTAYISKTGPITGQEISDWNEADKRLAAIDINEAKTRVQIDKEPSYE